MSGGAWQITNHSTAGGAGSVTISAAAGAATDNQQIRLRALQVSVAGTSAGTAEAVVRDGASGSGTVLWSADFAIVVNGGAHVEMGDVDLRASVGNALTVEFTSGLAGALQSVNAQGDLVPRGAPFGEP